MRRSFSPAWPLLAALAACAGDPAAPSPPAPPTPGAVRVPRVFPGLSFSRPVALLQAPGDAARWFVVEQGGRVLSFDGTSAAPVATPSVDITARVVSNGELGLLGMAFHPQWPAVPEAFLSYTRASPRLQSVVSRFRSADGRTLDPGSEQVILTVDQPFENHDGGNVAFGPDGMLYLGLGDGGSGGDPLDNGQDPTTLLGKMIRLEVRGTGAGYSIPADNPYAGNARCPSGAGSSPCPESWALGFRNPWRWSFDRATGDLWVGDVGQGAWEEVDRVVRGGNYGWRFREGAHCFLPPSGCPSPGTVVNGGPVVDPVAEYDHGPAGGSSITGGYVYRGSALPGLRGLYLFGDFGSGRLWTHAPGGAAMNRTELLATSLSIASFAEDAAGEILLLDYSSGGIFRLEP
jgi:glucose/arabinose dehydrogenase